MPWRLQALVDGDVHQMPDVGVARADEVAGELTASGALGREADRPTASRARARTSKATRAPGNERRSIASTAGQVRVGERADRGRRPGPRQLSAAVSLQPALRIGSSQVGRRDRGGPARLPKRRQRADPGGRERCSGVVIGRHLDPRASISARKRSAPSPPARAAAGPPRAAAELRRSGHERATRRRRAPAKTSPRRASITPRQGRPRPRASASAAARAAVDEHTDDRQVAALRERAGGRDSDPEPGERARPDADGDQVDRLPAAGLGDRSLDRRQQLGRVARAAVRTPGRSEPRPPLGPARRPRRRCRRSRCRSREPGSPGRLAGDRHLALVAAERGGARPAPRPRRGRRARRRRRRATRRRRSRRDRGSRRAGPAPRARAMSSR